MSGIPAGLPRQRMIVMVDVERSTSRNNVQKAGLREHMYGLLEQALMTSGIGAEHLDPLVDRGDGAMVLVHPVDEVPKTFLLTRFVSNLSGALATHNADHPPQRFRLRVAIHTGDVHYDHHGVFGADIDLTARLLDDPRFKTAFRRSSAPLILVISDHIYRAVVRHGYDGIDTAAFEPTVTVTMADCSHRGWVRVPSAIVQTAWPFHPITGDTLVDEALHMAGRELDARAAVPYLDPAAVVARAQQEERDRVPGAG